MASRPPLVSERHLAQLLPPRMSPPGNVYLAGSGLSKMGVWIASLFFSPVWKTLTLLPPVIPLSYGRSSGDGLASLVGVFPPIFFSLGNARDVATASFTSAFEGDGQSDPRFSYRPFLKIASPPFDDSRPLKLFPS